jgi:hypothetical protein
VMSFLDFLRNTRWLTFQFLHHGQHSTIAGSSTVVLPFQVSSISPSYPGMLDDLENEKYFGRMNVHNFACFRIVMTSLTSLNE